MVDRPVAADLVTYVYQYNVAPWAERSVVDGKTGETVRTNADESPAEVIGARIAAHEVPATRSSPIATRSRPSRRHARRCSAQANPQRAPSANRAFDRVSGRADRCAYCLR